MATVVRRAGEYPEPVVTWWSGRRLRFVVVLVLLGAFYSASWHLAKVDPGRVLTGRPRMAGGGGEGGPPRHRRAAGAAAAHGRDDRDGGDRHDGGRPARAAPLRRGGAQRDAEPGALLPGPLVPQRPPRRRLVRVRAAL